MHTRPNKRIMKPNRGIGGAIAVAVLTVAAFVALLIVASNLIAQDRISPSPQPTVRGAADPAITRNTPHTNPAITEVGQAGGFAEPLAARSAVLLDDQGKVLYALAADEKRYPASSTKVLTALLALEYGTLSDVIRVGDEANMPKPGSSSAGLRYGEKLTLGDLLHALLIPSGNDAAYVIAAYTGRKIAGDSRMEAPEAVSLFVQRMNDRAKELGATHSHFVNPDGFHDDEHYTTAGDMARIARQAMTHDEFRDIVATRRYALPDITVKSENGKSVTRSRVLQNTNELIDDSSPCFFSRCTGVKTGHTSQSGYCLVSSAEDRGGSVLAVVMDSTQDAVWSDSSALLQWGLSLR